MYEEDDDELELSPQEEWENEAKDETQYEVNEAIDRAVALMERYLHRRGYSSLIVVTGYNPITRCAHMDYGMAGDGFALQGALSSVLRKMQD